MSHLPLLADVDAPDRGRRPLPPRPALGGRPRPAGHSLRFRLRRIATFTVLILVAATLFSLFSALKAPSNSPLGIRMVEWLRDNGAAWVVSDAESFYYSWNAPSTGGRRLSSLPGVGIAAAARSRGYAPPAVAPVILPALSGEGRWHGTGLSGGGGSPVLVTTFRPDPNYPHMV